LISCIGIRLVIGVVVEVAVNAGRRLQLPVKEIAHAKNKTAW
jgi:hypothetical protein